MAKIKQDFQIYKGEVKNIILTIKDAAGALVDVSGKDMLYRVSKDSKSTSYMIEKDQSAMEILSTGVVQISFNHDDTDELKSGLWYHEHRVIDGNNAEIVTMTGAFKLEDSNTNVITI